MTACAFCGSDVTEHDPVTVVAGAHADGEPVGQFCNYACLAEWIDTEDLTQGAACRFDPTEA